MATEHLRNNQRFVNDEYYTKKEDVKKIFTEYSPFLKGKHIIMPFDTDDSEFVKYVKQNARNNEWTYEYSWGDYKQHDYNKKNAVVVSNPPFSMKREIIEHLQQHKMDFILILPALWARCYRNIAPLANREIMKYSTFIRPDGTESAVNVYVFTNFVDIYHRVRFDTACTHPADSSIFWSRGDISWNCFNKHEIKQSTASWNPMMVNMFDFISRPKQGGFSIMSLKPEFHEILGEYFKKMGEKRYEIHKVKNIRNSFR